MMTPVVGDAGREPLPVRAGELPGDVSASATSPRPPEAQRPPLAPHPVAGPRALPVLPAVADRWEENSAKESNSLKDE